MVLALMIVLAAGAYGDLTPRLASPPGPLSLRERGRTATASYPPTPLPRREGGKTTVVRLKAEAEVRGEMVRVADVAVVEGSEEAKARIGEVVVGPSPLPGEARMISAGYVKLRLRKAGVGLEDVRVEGDWVKVRGGPHPPALLPRREEGTATSPPGPLSTEWRGGGTTAARGAGMVKRGEAVEVWVRAGGIVIKTGGRAVSEGLIGDVVSVRVDQTQTIVSGVVIGKGICEVRM